jgi:hypothetical protein
MTSFRYPLPEAEPTSPWGGFSDEARTALTRLAMGPSPANQLLTPDGNGAEGLSAEAASWARVELDNNFADGALGSWDRYSARLGQTVPRTAEELLQVSPNLATRFENLYRAKQDLIASNEATPEDLNVGETMKLVLMPWRTLKDNLHRLPEWIKELRDIQGLATSNDYFNDDLLAALQNGTEMYRNPVPGMTSRSYVSAEAYLDHKLTTDGDWGVILAQTSDHAGLKRLVEGPAEQRSPDALTNNGSEHFKVADHDVDHMGILEWLSLTFQEDPSKLSSQDVSWFLANRFEVSGVPHVPYGYWRVGQVESYLLWAAYRDDVVRVRLAVM